MYNLALFSSINFVPYERKLTQKESFQTTYVCRTSMQKTINCVIPKRLFGLLLNCWLETQSTQAVLDQTIFISEISMFFAHFCSPWKRDLTAVQARKCPSIVTPIIEFPELPRWLTPSKYVLLHVFRYFLELVLLFPNRIFLKYSFFK